MPLYQMSQPQAPGFPSIGPGHPEYQAALQKYNADLSKYAQDMAAWTANQRNLADEAFKAGDATLAKELSDKAETAADNLRRWQGGQNDAERSAALAQLRTQGEESRATATASADRLYGTGKSQADAEAAIEQLRQSGRLTELGKTQDFTKSESEKDRTLTASESAAERAARLAEQSASADRLYGAGKSQSDAEAAIEQLRQSGRVTELETQGGQARQTIGTQAGADQAIERLRQSGRLTELDKTQAFQGSESAASRAAEMARLKETIAGQQGLASSEQAARLKELEAQGSQTRQTIGSQSSADLALETLRTSGARTLGQDRAAAEMAQLEKQISGQQGLATTEQAARMAELTAQLRSQEGISAAERLSRMDELRQTQSGTKELAGYQSQLQKDLEDARYARAREEQDRAFGRSGELLTRFGFGTSATGTGNAPDWFSSLVGASGGTGGGTTTGGGTPSSAQDASVEDQVWARAKDKIGQANEAGLRGLSEQMAERGIKGSGIEAQALGALKAEGQGQLANAATTAALETLKRRYQTSDSDKALALQKRGQDVGLIGSLTGSYRPSASGGVY